MSTLKKLTEHEKRWNIKIDDSNVFDQFKNRIVFDLKKETFFWPREFWDKFDYIIGTKAVIDDLSEMLRKPQDEFLKLLDLSPNLKVLATYLQKSFISVEDLLSTKSEIKRDLKKVSSSLLNSLTKALELTPQIGIEVTCTKTQTIIYPKGVKLLDENVVNQNLFWLESHPNVLKHFEGALIHYMQGDKRKYRNLLDDLRFALEQLLKDILQNDKSLENQKTELFKWLENQGVHQQTRNMYQTLLFGQYSQFQNDAVKHGEEFTENDIEFMIYLTGTFMRLLLQLEQNAIKNEN